MKLFRPKVSLDAVYAIARAAGIGFPEILEKAAASGQAKEQQAKTLRAKADHDRKTSNEKLEKDIAEARKRHAESMAGVGETETKAAHEAAEAREILDAVAEVKMIGG